jgi:hypothetical protein
MAFLKVNPFFEALRSNPCFQDPLRRMNFSPGLEKETKSFSGSNILTHTIER